MPAEIFHSVIDGTYSTISCSVLGTKPGMMRPIPFSIHTPVKAARHAMSSITSFRDSLHGKSTSTAEVTFSASADQIHGTSAVFPCRPTKR